MPERSQQSSLNWLKAGSNNSSSELTTGHLTGTSSLGNNTSIACFPYGLTAHSNFSLDLFTDSKPIYLRLFWNLLMPAIGIGFTAISYFLLCQIMDPIRASVFAFSFVIIGLIYWSIGGKTVYEEALDKYINRKVLKLKEIRTSERGLHFVSIKSKKNGGQERVDLGLNGYDGRNNNDYFTDERNAIFLIPWKDLYKITLANKESQSFNKLALKFAASGNLSEPFSIPLSTIHTHENWQVLTKAIRKYAVHVEIDPAIARALTLSSTDTSFTELWLKSLAHPPEEEALLTADEGAALNNGRYKITHKLAVGGQGLAYVAHDQSLDQEVVIKEYLLPVYQGRQVIDQAVKQLESEALTLQRIKHPQIVEFVDWFSDKHKAFLVLKKIPGMTLRQWIRRHGAADEKTAENFLRQMCKILHYLHSFTPPIIHRDFTPDNLIVTPDLKLTLIDFTIAEPTGAISGLPPSGKPAYMPPEQFRGEAFVQSDIYAMGGTLYFLLTAHDPQALLQPNLQQEAKEKGEGQQASQASSRLMEALSHIIFVARSQDLEKRFQSVEQVVQKLP